MNTIVLQFDTDPDEFFPVFEQFGYADEVRKKKRIFPQVKIVIWVSDSFCPLRRLILVYNRYRLNCMKGRNYDL